MWGPPTRQAIAPPRSPGLEPKWLRVLTMALGRVVLNLRCRNPPRDPQYTESLIGRRKRPPIKDSMNWVFSLCMLSSSIAGGSRLVCPSCVEATAVTSRRAVTVQNLTFRKIFPKKQERLQMCETHSSRELTCMLSYGEHSLGTLACA